MINSRFVRRLLGLFVLLATVALLVVVFRYFNRDGQQNKQKSSSSAPVDLALKSLHFTESDAGQKVWELFAASGDYNKGKDLSVLKDLRFTLFKSGIGPVTVTARRGEYQHAARRVTLAGDVNAMGEGGVSFATQRVTYDTARRAFSTAAQVRLVDGRMTVEGVGMDLDVAGQQARIKSRVSATIYPGKSDK